MNVSWAMCSNLWCCCDYFCLKVYKLDERYRLSLLIVNYYPSWCTQVFYGHWSRAYQISCLWNFRKLYYTRIISKDYCEKICLALCLWIRLCLINLLLYVNIPEARWCIVSTTCIILIVRSMRLCGDYPAPASLSHAIILSSLSFLLRSF